ncbi:MAG: hypothetical protein KAG34_07355 [Cocleimonas sp.]|nr:hypothetical protein [Cocleimonas sp.]
MLKQIEIFAIAMMFVLITAIILIIYTMQRGQEFKAHQSTIQKATVHGAAYAVKLQLANKHRHVRLFLDEYEKLVTHLILFPTDTKTASDIKERLQQRFTDFFTFTVTNQKGVPLLLDFDSLVGDACMVDLQQYFKSISRKEVALNKVFVHPQPYHYHYDIMAPLYSSRAGAHIFFASFDLRDIIDIIRTHEIPGQTLMLVKRSDPTLIEAAKQGARDKLTFREVRLSKEEQQAIRVYENIPDTDWRLVNIPDADFERHYLRGLWIEAAIIIFIVTLALLLLIFILARYNTERKES